MLVSLTILLLKYAVGEQTVIATLSIPTSMIATFAFMHVMGFTLNNITMLGLILAIGIVVDDAVVVHENIFRHMEEYGLSAWEAAGAATKEIQYGRRGDDSVAARDFCARDFHGRTSRAVFQQLRLRRRVFDSDEHVHLVYDDADALRFSRPKTDSIRADRAGCHAGWKGFYMLSLRFSLRHRWLIVLITVGVLASTPGLMAVVGKDFVPRDQCLRQFEVAVTLPEGFTLDRADQVLSEVDLRLRKLRGVKNTFLTIGDTTGRTTRGQGEVTKASIYCKLSDLADREFSQFDVMVDARKFLLDYPDLRAAVQDVAAISQLGLPAGDDQSATCADRTWRSCRSLSEKISTSWMTSRGHYVDVDTSLWFPQAGGANHSRIRERASGLGVLPVGRYRRRPTSWSAATPVSKYKEADQQYDVWLRADHAFRDDPSEIARLTVPSTKAGVGVVELGNMARFEEACKVRARSRHGLATAASRRLGQFGREGVGRGSAGLTDFVKTLDLPADYRLGVSGQAKNLNDTMANFVIAFGLAFLFMYMILAAKFESLVHPITILLALPLTVPFAVLSLIMLQTDLDIYAMFGLFMLFGIVKKNGILQVDYTNVLRERGVPRDQAILDANAVRLRPILMTTVMLVAAIMPMGKGPGAAWRAKAWLK